MTNQGDFALPEHLPPEHAKRVRRIPLSDDWLRWDPECIEDYPSSPDDDAWDESLPGAELPCQPPSNLAAHVPTPWLRHQGTGLGTGLISYYLALGFASGLGTVAAFLSMAVFA
jgi:hypothetical protein